MPVIPGLKELLDELKTRPRRGLIQCLSPVSGEAWTPDGLNGTFQDTRLCVDARGNKLLTYVDEEGQQHWKRLHDIRGTYTTKLMTQPSSRLRNGEIAELMGVERKASC